MEDFVGAALARLPLADAVLHLWRYVADEAFLDSLYERNRGRCYVRVISFSNLVQLMASALLEHDGSGRASFETAQEKGTLDASVWAAFQKLGNTPLAVSEALLAEGTTRLMQLFPDHDHAGDIPTSLAEFEVIPLDGKAIKKVAKRLKPLRGVSGGLLGGRALVAMHLRTGMALAMATHEDGEANDARFMPELLAQVRGLVPGCRLYVGDRQYCDLVQAERFTQQGDHFLVRYHCKNTFTVDTKAGVRKGRDPQGRAYTECWGWMGSAHHPTGVWRPRWVKSPKKKLPATKDKKRPKRRAHGSVFRILEDLRLGPQKRGRSRASTAQRC